MVDVGAEQTRLELEYADLSKQIARLEDLLSSPFAQKAPDAVVKKERDKLTGLLSAQNEVRERLESINTK